MASDATQDSGGTVRRRRAAMDPFRPLGPWPPGYILLWVFTLISVVMNALILRQLLLARQIAQRSVEDSIAVIEGLQQQVITYNFVIDQDLPIDADIPVTTTIPIQLDEDFPLETTVTVSVPAGPLGTIPVRVPISTTVPIHRTVMVNIDEVFALDTSIPVYFEVPISVAVSDTPLYVTLEETKTRLLLLSETLNRPLLPFLSGGTEATQEAPVVSPTPIEADLPTAEPTNQP